MQVPDDPDQTGAATAADVEPGRRQPLTEKKKTLTTAFGIPVADDQNSLTAGPDVDSGRASAGEAGAL